MILNRRPRIKTDNQLSVTRASGRSQDQGTSDSDDETGFVKEITSLTVNFTMGLSRFIPAPLANISKESLVLIVVCLLYLACYVRIHVYMYGVQVEVQRTKHKQLIEQTIVLPMILYWGGRLAMKQEENVQLTADSRTAYKYIRSIVLAVSIIQWPKSILFALYWCNGKYSSLGGEPLVEETAVV